MTLTAFTSRLGRGQGRIRPANAAPASGDYLFVLGEDEPGRLFELAQLPQFGRFFDSCAEADGDKGA
jgi:hypothetical protein